MHRLLGLALVLPLLSACDPKDCTLVGCASQLALTITGPGEVIGLSGSVTVGEHTFLVDCASDSDPAVTCDGASLVLDLPEGVGGGEVEWSLSSDGPDGGESGGSYAGEGAFTPDWTSSTPNGPDCGPECWSGAGSVELLGTP
ncbi:MAG: hypothetical protein V4850_03045 [Myxococcota bacterium]